MDITFSDRKLEKTFNEEKSLLRAYGRDMAKKIALRMAVLRAANNLQQVPVDKPLRRHELKGDWRGHFAVDLAQPFRLVFRPAANPVPLRPDGGADLTQVTAIEIVAVTNYH